MPHITWCLFFHTTNKTMFTQNHTRTAFKFKSALNVNLGFFSQKQCLSLISDKWTPLYIYMGSSSVLVLIGSHSLCNSFVVNQFLFFTPNGENSLCYTPKKQWEQYGGKKMFCLFFISKIYSHVTQKWRPKTGMAIPYCLCWKLLHTRRKYSDISNLFAKLQHAKAPES